MNIAKRMINMQIQNIPNKNTTIQEETSDIKNYNPISGPYFLGILIK